MTFPSPVPTKRARIEIIPLIDVMFFLLASFMLISLQLQRLRTLKMSLPGPAAAATTIENKPIEVSVDRDGEIQVERETLSLSDLVERVGARVKGDPTVQIFITADSRYPYGSMVNILDRLRSVGGEQVSFDLDNSSQETKP